MRACGSCPLHKTCFRRGKRVDTLGAVLPGSHALALLAGAALAVAALAVLRAIRSRRRAGLPEPVERILTGALDPFGDGVLVLGKEGRIASANAAAVRLAGSDAAPLEGKQLSAVAEVLAVLWHGLARAHSTGGSCRSAPGSARAPFSCAWQGHRRSTWWCCVRIRRARRPRRCPRHGRQRSSRRASARSSPARLRA